MFDGEKLKYSRMVRDFSRKELAEKLGIPEQAIGQYETGAISPKFDVLVKLNELFGVSNKYFLNVNPIQVLNFESNIAFRNSDREQRGKIEFEKYFLSDIHGYMEAV